MSDDLLHKYDAWLSEEAPAALVLQEWLVPAEGPEGVVFPATFAASEDKTFKGGYNIDSFPDGSNVCLIDSVGSQANRMEPLFLRDQYAGLVPQIVVQAGQKKINLLEAGHRSADAVVRCSKLGPQLTEAFRAWLDEADAAPLARLAPTSLVFGVWDSRGTKAKIPRLLASVVRAFNVRPLTRSSQYIPPVDYVDQGLLPEAEGKAQSDKYAERGFVHVPASAKPGGVEARGGIRRDATLSLVGMRALRAKDPDQTKALQRYVLGLALTAFSHPAVGELRQGCLLVGDPQRPAILALVHGSGHRDPVQLGHQDALDFATAAARAFGVGESMTVAFSTDLAKTDLEQEKGGKPAEKGTQPTEKGKGRKGRAAAKAAGDGAGEVS